jgi:hypothetical protein
MMLTTTKESKLQYLRENKIILVLLLQMQMTDLLSYTLESKVTTE